MAHGSANEAVNQLVLARMSINTITRNFPRNRTHLSPAETGIGSLSDEGAHERNG